jgi:import inner membrane translocase subunit TIM50
MFTRAALRAARPSLSSATRTYAQSSRPSRPPPPPKASKPPPRPTTSKPSTSKPVAAAAAAATGASKTAAQQPIAQQQNLDEPPADNVRSQAQNAQAGAENTTQPDPNAQPAPSASKEAEVEAEMPSGPLPDLRQGIPSTFDFEFGGAKKDPKVHEAEKAQNEAADMAQLEAEAAEAGGRGKKGDDGREYSRSDYETSLDRRRAKTFNYMYLAALAAGVAGGAYFTRPFSANEEVPVGLDPELASGWGPTSMYSRVRARMGHQLGYYTEPSFPKLLPTVPENQRQPFTLVLSLEDLMIHTTWDRKNGYRTAKRPGIDYFIRYLSQYYELVLFTSVPIAMADPVIKKLDPFHFIMWPLGREATKYENGQYVKDLEYLNRDLSKTIIIDTNAAHVKNQPENAVVLPKWKGDPKDEHVRDLVGLIPFLEYVATMGIDDVRPVIKSFEGKDIPEEFMRRENEARKRFLAQYEQQKSKAGKFSLGGMLGANLGIKGDKMGGGMVLADGQSVSEGLAQGKMLSDQIREQGQKQYEHLEKQIREHGAQWLKEEEEETKKMMDAQMKDMKSGAFSWFGTAAKKE